MIDPSSVQYLEINGPDFAGRKFVVISNERVDTGSGVLKAPIMPLPTLLLGIFGTPASFYLNTVSGYDPETGIVTTSAPTAVAGKVYAESYTLEESSSIPEVLQGDIKVYVPGELFGYNEVALLILQVRETGNPIGRIE
jgi:hypothetical protein